MLKAEDRMKKKKKKGGGGLRVMRELTEKARKFAWKFGQNF